MKKLVRFYDLNKCSIYCQYPNFLTWGKPHVSPVFSFLFKRSTCSILPNYKFAKSYNKYWNLNWSNKVYQTLGGKVEFDSLQLPRIVHIQTQFTDEKKLFQKFQKRACELR